MQIYQENAERASILPIIFPTERTRKQEQNSGPHIYEGRFVNVNRRPDGRLYPSLTRPPYTEAFTFRHFCLAAAEELRMVADMIG